VSDQRQRQLERQARLGDKQAARAAERGQERVSGPGVKLKALAELIYASTGPAAGEETPWGYLQSAHARLTAWCEGGPHKKQLRWAADDLKKAETSISYYSHDWPSSWGAHQRASAAFWEVLRGLQDILAECRT